MTKNIYDYITKSNREEWKPLIEEGVNTDGIFVKVLRFDESTQRPPTFLLKLEAGASYPYHNHPAGEEAFVLEGEVTIGGAQLTAGDYLYTPPGGKHSVQSEKGCVILFMVPKEVEILED